MEALEWGVWLSFKGFKHSFPLTNHMSIEEVASPKLTVKLGKVGRDSVLIFNVPYRFLWFEFGMKKIIFNEPFTQSLLKSLLDKYGEGFEPDIASIHTWS